MTEKNFNARFKQKHDIEANWAKATFAPLAGEFIVYDVDENNSTPRIKIGDGETQINDLPFVGNGEASGIKKIGFTNDCDYMATSTNGLTAFTQAISEAADGDTILVMPGTYTSDSTLAIEKNINFIGVSSPIINFPINVLGPVYDYENYTGWLSETEYDIHFENLTFNKQLSVTIESYDTVKSSRICAVNCIFNGVNKIRLGYLGKAYNCIFNNSELSTAGYIGYSGGDMRFYDCKLNNITYTEYSYAEMNFKYYNCDITFANNNWEYPGGTFNNCNISAATEEYITIQTEYPGVSLNNCKIFGKNPFRASNENIVYNNTFVYPYIEEEDDSGDLAGETSCFKKIGFTSDCDYVATNTDGYTAFSQAVAQAAEGDTILVMGGTYKGSTTLNIDKDITFIAVGDAVIDFDVKTQGGGVFSYENWEWTEIYEGKHTKWDGFSFKKSFIVGIECNPDNTYYNGFATVKNCSFNSYTTMVGNCYNCDFNSDITIGHYYGADSSTFTDCRFSCSITANTGSDTFKRCDFHFDGNNSVNFTTWKEDNFVNCKMYAPNDILTIQDSHGSGPLNLNDTVIFAVSVVNGSYGEITGGYLVSYTPIGGTSSGGTTAEYVTRTEMEEYVNETIIGGEW